MRQSTNQNQQEWLKILGKGMVTIPKTWRDELGLEEGEMVKAEKIGNTVVLKTRQDSVPYRIFSDTEIEEFLKEDRLPQVLEEKVNKKIASLSK